MSEDLLLDVGQANELKLAFRRAHFSNAQIKTLSEGLFLRDVLKVINGEAEIKLKDHIIDGSCDPCIPDGFKIEYHKKNGLFKFDTAKISLYLSLEQKRNYYIIGNDLRKEVAQKKIANANVLDHLILHQELIPEEWRGKAIFFWGTIYRRHDGNLFVRHLYHRASKWRWNFSWLGRDFDFYHQALIL